MEIEAVHRDDDHRFSKQPAPQIRLVTGLGVAGDAHFGATVQHRSRVRRNPEEPNLRQVHLIHVELLDDLCDKGHDLRPGVLGENVTTRGLDLLGLPVGTRLHLGDEAVVELTGLRNPCRQIDHCRPGVLKEVLGRDADGSVVRRTGVMSVVVVDGVVRPRDPVSVVLPAPPHRHLVPV